jgi:hypothetical protein
MEKTLNNPIHEEMGALILSDLSFFDLEITNSSSGMVVSFYSLFQDSKFKFNLGLFFESVKKIDMSDFNKEFKLMRGSLNEAIGDRKIIFKVLKSTDDFIRALLIF